MIYGFYIKRNKRIKATKDLEIWIRNGRPSPPPQLYKRLVIKEFAEKYGIRILIETGTYQGDTVDYFKSYFKKLISIELDEKLYEKARKKFLKNKNIEIYGGDSGEVIQKVIEKVSEPCLFWLDGHYSEGVTAKGKLNTPILAELNHILDHKIDNHVILIDDARCFNGHDDYPTIEYLHDFILKKNPQIKYSIKDDIIRIHI